MNWNFIKAFIGLFLMNILRISHSFQITLNHDLEIYSLDVARTSNHDIPVTSFSYDWSLDIHSNYRFANALGSVMQWENMQTQQTVQVVSLFRQR